MNPVPPDQAKILRYGKRVAVAVLVFAVISGHLLGISAWAIESGSMETNMHIGDLVFTRNVPRTGIVTHEDGATSGYKTFGDYGNVILYRKYGRTGVAPNRTPRNILCGSRRADVGLRSDCATRRIYHERRQQN